MKRGDLLRHLEQCGCRVEREGARHTIYLNPAKNKKTSLPRHTEIDNRLALKICKQLGVPPVGR
jgi:mRNA interferase HicA